MSNITREQIIQIATDNYRIFDNDFPGWLTANFHIWEGFRNQAIKVRGLGYDHYSARTIIEFLRHHTALTEGGNPWKINNNRTTDLARLFDIAYPQHAGLFHYRTHTLEF